MAIVDRKKNLVKLSGGEYVALEFAEMVFGNCDCVDAVAGGVMVSSRPRRWGVLLRNIGK